MLSQVQYQHHRKQKNVSEVNTKGGGVSGGQAC
jgi:hypothetical protein